MSRRLVAFAGLFLLVTSAHAQVLPPPPLPGQGDVTKNIIRSLEDKDLSLYTSLMAKNLVVFEDGKKVAITAKQWVDRFKRQLSTEGTSFKFQAGYSSTGELTLIDKFTSYGSWGGQVPNHCCTIFYVTKYKIRGDKVAEISRITAGDQAVDK